MEITRLLKLMNSCTWTTTTTAGETLSEDNVTLSEPGTIFHKLRLDDWLPMLELVANQNGWSEDEKLKLLAGRLHGKAVCECTVLYLQRKMFLHYSCTSTSILVGPKELCTGSSRIQECTTA